MRVAIAAVVVLVTLGLVREVKAQGSISGVARSADDGTPIPFALIRLLRDDSASTDARLAALTEADGRYAFRGLSPGVYRVQLDRIGFEKVVSSALRLASGQAIQHDIRGAAAAVRLSAVKVLPGRCLKGDELAEDQQLETLWREARKGLEGRRGFELLYQFTRTLTQDITFDRRFLPDMLQHRVGKSVSTPDSVAAQLRRDQETHRAKGYVTNDNGQFLVTVPEETELLDDEFLKDFCFESSPEHVDGAYALRFRSLAPRTTGYGLRGTIWLEESFLIRRLELEHVKGDSAMIKSRVEYSDVSVDGSKIRLRSGGRLEGRAEGLAMVNGVRARFSFRYSNFKRVTPP